MKKKMLKSFLVILLPVMLYGQEIDTADYRYAASTDCFEAGGADLKIWYKTSTNVNSSGYPPSVTRSGTINVTGWDDEAGVNASDFQNLENNGANSTLPSYLLNQINGYGAVKFGNDDRLTSSTTVAQDNLRTEAFSSDETLIVVVVKRSGGSTFLSHGSGSSLMELDYDEFWWGEDPSGTPTSQNYFDFSANSIGSDFEIRTIRVSEDVISGNTTFYVYKNGEELSSKTTSVAVNVADVTANIILGDDAATSGYELSIAELMVFNYDYGFDAQDLEQIHTHLSLKYGISLQKSGAEYLSWDNATNLFPASTQCGSEGSYSQYSNRITGIFKNGNCFDVEHLKSTNYESGSILTGALTHNSGSFSNPSGFDKNRTYFTWGDDNGATTFNSNNESVDIPSALYAAPYNISNQVVRIKRKWKVRETYRTKTPTGNIGEITYEFDLSGTDINSSLIASDIFIFIDTDKDGSFTDEDNTSGGILNPTSWDDNLKTGYFSYDFSQCDVFSIGVKTGNPLPVVWVNFDAIKLNNKTQLSWSTALEINNSHFEIQKSDNGQDWTVIGEVSGKGDYNDYSTYSFIDNTPYEGSNFYRIKQVDYDGKYTFTNIEGVEFSNDILGELKLYPNPSNEMITIQVKSIGQDYAELISYRIIDLSGSTVIEGIINNGSESISTIDLKEGVYLVNLQQGNFVKTSRLVIAR